MELLEQRILRDGKVKPGGILKVDSFLNHQLDPMLMHEMAKELHRLFDGQGVNKILTIEASGIALAIISWMRKKLLPTVSWTRLCLPADKRI